jgi:hypothetical protein
VSRNTISHPGLCQQAPARWADPHQQAATRRLCLSCPRLDRCRRETLTENRTFGMWAGVWIDHDLPDKRHLLKPGPRLRSRPPPTPSRRTRVGTLPVNELPPNAAAMVTARASGHCEILAPACLLHQQLIFTRRPQGAAQPPDSPFRPRGLQQLRRTHRTNRPRHRAALRLHHRPPPTHHPLAGLLAATTLGPADPFRSTHRPPRPPRRHRPPAAPGLTR